MDNIRRPRSDLPGASPGFLLDDGSIRDHAAIAGAICGGGHVMLVLARTSSGAVSGIVRFASDLDRPPPDPARILELHQDAGGDAVLLPTVPDPAWAGFGYCGVGLREPGADRAAGALLGVLCVLRRQEPRGPRLSEPRLSITQMAAFEALGRQLSARGGDTARVPMTPPGMTVAAADEPAPRAGAARILVVDDEEVVRMLVVDLLRERGYAVQEAEDAHGAMTRLQSGEDFDLMVTDIGLPNGFDGSTLARQARALHAGLPILFITGYAFGANNDITLEPGIPVLTKPFTLAALSARIGDLLASTGASRPI